MRRPAMETIEKVVRGIDSMSLWTQLEALPRAKGYVPSTSNATSAAWSPRRVGRFMPCRAQRLRTGASRNLRRRHGDIRFKSKHEARENYHPAWRKSRDSRTVKPAFGCAAGARRRDTSLHAPRCSRRRAPRHGCPHGSRAGAATNRRDRDAELLLQRATRSRGLALAGGKRAREARRRPERRRARRDPGGSGSRAENLAHGVPVEIAPRVLGHRVDLRIVPEERAETLRAGRIPARAGEARRDRGVLETDRGPLVRRGYPRRRSCCESRSARWRRDRTGGRKPVQPRAIVGRARGKTRPPHGPARERRPPPRNTGKARAPLAASRITGRARRP